MHDGFNASFFQLVMHRREELLSLECEMSTVHAFLSAIPENVDYERLLKQAWDTFQHYPPNIVARAGQIDMSSRYYNYKMHKRLILCKLMTFKELLL